MNKKTIYCFANLINNKQYIGSTINDPVIRYKQHLYNSTHKNTHQYYYPLYQDIRKYGIDNFSFSILFQKNCSEKQIRQIEQKYIINMKTLYPNGYNQTINTLHPINDLTIYKKIKETKREKAKQVVLIDQKNNIIKQWRSIIDCAEQLKINEKKIAACCRGERKTTNNKRFCWIQNNKIIIPTYTKEFYKGQKGTTQFQKTNKKVAKIDLITNKTLQTYESIALAARENNCDSSAICKVCKGKRNKCGGFKWKYIV